MSEDQAMLDKALKITKSTLVYVEGDNRNNFEFLKLAMIRSLKEIALALGDLETYEKNYKRDQ
ncbi:hypothetical protein EC844_12542 [Acinetobacter calcoaceticus]|uniref:Uncharacterized protein n=1 Tax=Acinetobacter calcoaceticus TaxID=471 RepID=A0A4R1XEZ1_ACICA|nr:hypothetical protein EC844_12542 [Acinetobacter calcoaceticus]